MTTRGWSGECPGCALPPPWWRASPITMVGRWETAESIARLVLLHCVLDSVLTKVTKRKALSKAYGAAIIRELHVSKALCSTCHVHVKSISNDRGRRGHGHHEPCVHQRPLCIIGPCMASQIHVIRPNLRQNARYARWIRIARRNLRRNSRMSSMRSSGRSRMRSSLDRFSAIVSDVTASRLNARLSGSSSDLSSVHASIASIGQHFCSPLT